MQSTACANASKYTAIVAFDGERQQHLHLLLHQRLIKSLQDYLQTGRRAVHEWLGQIRASQALFDAPQAFRNINRPEDLDL